MFGLSALIVGETGQLARALITATPENITVNSLSRADLDLSWSKAQILDSLIPYKNTNILINAAAYTAVDSAEDDAITANSINADTPAVLAEFCKFHGITFIHVSTDYVFDGSQNTPYRIDDTTQPLGVYGRSKRQGELAVVKTGGRYAILRASWVFDGTGENFMTKMLRLGQSCDILNVVHDQIGRPTFAGTLADACWTAAMQLIGNKNKSGIYHVSGTGDPISWADFAREIFVCAKNDLPHDVSIGNIGTADYPTCAKRPHYSVLDVSAFENTFKSQLPNWQDGLNLAMNDWRNTNPKDT